MSVLMQEIVLGSIAFCACSLGLFLLSISVTIIVEKWTEWRGR